ncbi:SDR family NAD(P)-dependent oxidoreductase [Zhongshania sp.]|uniref:SDR family NAD(P)-dependent oxidoreductase n=1 Tax=Zhongshania sp. TaxID=1971902 RepID=UPI00356A2130
MEYSESVAVITGGAGGIGLALAHEAVRRGMKVVIADIRQDALDTAVTQLSAAGGEVFGVRTDVTKIDSVTALAEATVARYGKVNLLINNAGAFVAGLAWDTPPEQYEWLINLNLKSVFHGIRSFVPRMIAQGDPCQVINIASAAGVTVYPGYASYSSTKHAVLGLSEALHLDLAAEGINNIGVTIAMPGIIRTAIMQPETASPADLHLERRSRFENATVRGVERMMSAGLDAAMSPEDAAQMIFDAASAGQLYVLPNHDSEGHQTLIQTIAKGRATGKDPYGTVLDNTLQSMARADAAANKIG